MGTVQPPAQRGRRHQRRPHAMLSQALLGMIQAAGAFQGKLACDGPGSLTASAKGRPGWRGHSTGKGHAQILRP